MIFFFVSQVTMAQWTYVLTIKANSSPTIIKHGPYSSKAECEQNRLLDIAANTQSSYIGGDGWGGLISINATATPCTGPGGGAIGNVDVLGVSKGSGFYSTNLVNEINDWSNDDMERMLALNPEYNIKDSKTVTTGDVAFDNLIENIHYSDEAFSGRMPRGNTNIEADDNIVAIGQPVRGNGVLVPDDFTDRPFTGLGGWSSDDLKSVELPQGTFRLYGDINYNERKQSVTDKVKSAISSLDERLDWYKAEDSNAFQYMYTRWGKENVMAGVDLWERYHIGERFSNAWDKVKEVTTDPLGTWEKKREEMVDRINENKDEHIGSGILFLLKPQDQVAGENAQDTYSTLKGSIKFVFEDISKSVDYAASGKVPDYMRTVEKVGGDVSGLAGRVAERSTGLPNLSKITKPITDVYRQPREKQGKEIANITGKELKKRAKSTVKDNKYYKGSKEKVVRLLDPNHVITE